MVKWLNQFIVSPLQGVSVGILATWVAMQWPNSISNSTKRADDSAVQYESSSVMSPSIEMATLSEQVDSLIETVARMQQTPSKRKFYSEDLLPYFNVQPINKNIIDPSIVDLLQEHNIQTDPSYELDFELEDWETVFGPLIDRGFEHDRRFYASYIDHHKGYGLFADVDILPNTLLGEYTGIISNNTGPTDYKWDYNSKPIIDILDQHGRIIESIELDLALDARLAGSMMRFVNHHDEPNAECVFVPYKNEWRVLYISTSFIAKDEEITVHYGYDYFDESNEDSALPPNY